MVQKEKFPLQTMSGGKLLIRLVYCAHFLQM